MKNERFDFLEMEGVAPRKVKPAGPAPAARPQHGGVVTVRVTEIIGCFGKGPGEFNCPAGIAVDAEGALYVADSLNHRVQRITADGEVTILGEPGPRPGQFTVPKGLVMDQTSHLYVVEQGTCRVQKFDPTGQWVTSFGSPGQAVGQFNAPTAVALDEYQNLYVADAGNGRVQVFTPGGGFLYSLPRRRAVPGQVSLLRPTGVAVHGPHLFIADMAAHQVARCSKDGEAAGAIGDHGAAPGQLAEPAAVAADAVGNLWVTELANNRLQRFSAEGQSEAIFTSQRGLPGAIRGPAGVAVDRPRGDVYLADTLNHRILRLVVEETA